MTIKTLVIAEAGVNHNGSLETAKELIKIAGQCGADYVKFQTFQASSIASSSAGLADYQKQNTKPKETQVAMLAKLELRRDWHAELISTADSEGIKFLTTTFDIESTKFVRELDLGLFKIPSGEITNLPYLRLIASYNEQTVLSTGMSTLGEIESAIRVFEEAGTSRSKITLLHCTTEYPTPFCDVNLSAMETLRRSFNVHVGYSDHTAGITIPIAAVALGASIIEKHFTLDKTFNGPDHQASIEPHELKEMIKSIREVEEAKGSSIKAVAASEIKNIPIARKSLVAKVDILKGDLFTLENLDCKRPGKGISPMMIDYVIGRVAPRSFKKDEIIEA